MQIALLTFYWQGSLTTSGQEEFKRVTHQFISLDSKKFPADFLVVIWMLKAQET